MTLNQFIQKFAIQPADAIIMQKKLLGMVDHYVIYVGVDRNNDHRFVANYTKGVKVIPNHELAQFLEVLVPSKIDRFPGPYQNRTAAVNRALSRVGEKSYNYLTNNCEHFKNWVHRGEHKSHQVDNAISGVAIGLGAIAVIGIIDAIFSGLNKQA